MNGSGSTVELPSLALALRVTRVGSSVACEDEPIALRAPTALAPGAVHDEPLPVSCLGLDVPGVYDVAARRPAGSMSAGRAPARNVRGGLRLALR